MSTILCTLCKKSEKITNRWSSSCPHYYCSDCFTNKIKYIEDIPDCESCYNNLFILPKPKQKLAQPCVKCNKKDDLLNLCWKHCVCRKCFKSKKYSQIIEGCLTCMAYYQYFCRSCCRLCKFGNRISNPNHPVDNYCNECFSNKKTMKSNVKCDKCLSFYRKAGSSSCRICKTNLKKSKSPKHELCKDHSYCNACFSMLAKREESHLILIIRCPVCIIHYKQHYLPPPVHENPPQFMESLPSESFLNYCILCNRENGINPLCGEHYICNTCVKNPPSVVPQELECFNCMSRLTEWFPNTSVRNLYRYSIKASDAAEFLTGLENQDLPQMKSVQSCNEGFQWESKTITSSSTQEMHCDKRHSQTMEIYRHGARKGSRSDVQCNLHGPTSEAMECGHPLCIHCITAYFLQSFRVFIEDVIKRDIEKLNKEDHTINCYHFPICYNKACIPFALVRDSAIEVLTEQNIHLDFADYFSLNFEGIKVGFYLCSTCGSVKDYSNGDECWVCKLAQI